MQELNKNPILQRLQHASQDDAELFLIFLFFTVGLSLIVLLKIATGYYQLDQKPVEPFRYQAGYWKV